MMPQFRLAATFLPVLSLLSLLNAGAQTPTTPPMMVQVPYVSSAAGYISGGTFQTSLPSSCTSLITNVLTTGGTNLGDGCPASSILIDTGSNTGPYSTAVDKWGNVYFSDIENYATGWGEVRVIYAGASVTVGGVANPATSMIEAANVTHSGLVPQTGYVYTVGGGYQGVLVSPYYCNKSSGAEGKTSAGSGCPATESYIKKPYGVAVDGDGNVFVADESNSHIYVILANASDLAAGLVTKENPSLSPQTGYIYLLAGNTGAYADGVLAINGNIHNPYAITVDASENLYITDYTNGAIRMVNGPNNSTSGGVAAGFIHTIGGNCGSSSCTVLGAAPSSGVAAIGAAFVDPIGVAVDSLGNIFIGDNGGAAASVPSTVRVIYEGGASVAKLICLEEGNTSLTCSTVTSQTVGDVYTIAGSGTTPGSAAIGNGGLATSAVFDKIQGLALDSHGNIYVADYSSAGLIAEINADTGYLAFLSGGAATSTLGVGDNCTGTTIGSSMTDNYGDGCPATESKEDHIFGNPSFDPSGNLYFADNGYYQIRKLTFNNSFPATTVGTPVTQNLAFELLAGATSYPANNPEEILLTQGSTTNSEFTAAGGTGDTCSGATTLKGFQSSASSVSSSTSTITTCEVPVTFKPEYAGARSGAVQITATINSSSVTMTPAYLNGIGNGAEVAIDPGSSSSLGSGSEPTGVATDSAGNVYVAYGNGTVYRTGGSPAEIGSGLTTPHQVAVDGAGNLYVADSGTNEIVEFAGASTISSPITGTPFISGLTGPSGVAVDASGNLYIAETGEVFMQPIGNGAQTVLGSGFDTPVALAVDAGGIVYVADSGLNEIEKLTIANGMITGQTPEALLSGAKPVSVAVDAAGDIYYGDISLGAVVEVPVSGTTATIASGFTNLVGIALDPSGNLYMADYNSTSGISYLNRTAATLPAIPDERTSDAALTNVGNTGYVGGVLSNTDLNVGADFSFAAGTSNGCSLPYASLSPLAAGNNCEWAITANTSTAIDTVTFTGGSTLAISSQASEVVGTTTTLNVTNTLPISYGIPITGTVTVTPSSGSLNPSGTVTFSEGTPSTCTLVSSTGNTSTCSFSLTGITAGSSTLTATYGGDSNNGASSGGALLNIAQVSTSTTLNVTSSTSLVEGSTSTGTATVTPTPDSGTVSLYLNGSSTAATSCSLSGGSCNWTLSGLGVASYSVTATYSGSTNYASSNTASGTSITVTAPPQAPAVATGDARTVTEPAFPAVCQQLSAAITSVNDDIPTSVDASISNPDGARIQAALNSCSTNNPGQAVELSVDSTGAYNAFLAGPISMPSNVTLLVDPGVYVYFSRNAQDYDKVAGTHTCGTVNSSSATSSCLPLIDIPKTSTNVGIMGFGKLDGRGGDTLINAIAPYQGQSWWGLSAIANSGGNQQNPRFIQMDTGASNITMYKITLRNSPLFHISTTGAVTGFTAWDIKIVTPTSSRNTDGIDPGNATNFTITRSWISDGDDNVAVGAAGTTAPAANISVTNNRFFAGHGESIGSYTSAGVSNILFDGNMSSGNGTAGSGSAVSSTGTFAGGIADSNSTGLRIKSGYDRGGLVTNIQYSNSCFQDHKAEIVFSTNYENTTGTESPNLNNILMQNLTFLTAGTAQLTGTSNNGTIYPLQVTMDNVSFPGTYPSSEFSPAPTNAALTYGPGDVSGDFVSDYGTFTGSNGNTVTSNITVGSLFPPTCSFTYVAPELTGPNGLPQTITEGQNAAAVVILTPAVGGAAYPTGTVTLTDSLTSNTYTASLPGTSDTISIPLTGLTAGTHTFTATYSGDSNYTGASPYSTTAPYNITVNSGSLTGTTTSLGLPVSTSVTSSYGTAVTSTAIVTGSNPTGSVQFVVSGGGLSGSYTYTTAAVTSGTASAGINLPFSTIAYSITAVYSGDSANAGSTSNAASLTVGAATTQTVLSVNPASATLGNPFIVTAAVTSVVGTPAAANVTFAYSTTLTGAQTTLGTALLNNGAATYFLNSLPVGSYYLFASYAGSASYGPSSSTGVAVTVTAATNIVQLNSNPIALPYTMTTIAGGSGLSIPSSGNMACTGATDKYGDGCQGTAMAFTSGDDMRAVVADPFGNVYVSDTSAALVRRISPNGIITNFAGKVSGSACVPAATTGCTPTLVTLGKARGVGTDVAGNIYIANYTGNQVFEVKVSTGLLYLVAGNGTAGSTGDGSAAASAEVNNPRGAWGDSIGNIYIADTANNKVRVVDAMGNIHTFAGAGGATSTGDGGPAIAATFDNPQGVFVDPNLNVYIADGLGKIRVVCVTCGTSSPLDYLLQAVGATGTLNSATNGYIYTIAGNGTSSTAYSGTWPTLSTGVSMAPQKLSMDTSGNLYISDSLGFIWLLDFHTGYIRAIAKNGTVCGTASSTYGYATYGDGCPATQAKFGSNGGNGLGVGADTLGNIYISDSTNGLIRKVITGLASPSTTTATTTAQPVLLHFASGDTKAPSNALAYTSSEWTLGAASCGSPNGDTTIDCLFTSSFTPAVPGVRSTPLTVNSSLGYQTNLAMTGTGLGAGATIDPAKQVSFGTGLSVAGLAVDSAGNVYVSDSNSKKILKYSSSGGNLTQGTSATATTLATLTAPGAIVVDPRGYVYAADTSTRLLTQITPAGAVSTLPFTFAAPAGLAVDALNNLYVSDSSAQTVYQINPITGVEHTLSLGTLTTPKGLSVDPSGNLLIADPGTPAIYRYNFATGTRTMVSTSATAPSAALTDAAGNLLIADTADILAVPGSSHSSSFTVASLAPSALAIDSAGNLYTGSNGGVLELIRTQGYVQYAGPSAPPAAVSMLESGNQALSLTSLSQTDTADYSLAATASTDCTVSVGLPSSVAIGGACVMTASYTPTTFVTTTDSVTLNGNPQNATLSTPSSIQLTLTGPATAPAPGISISSFSPASPVYGQSVTAYATVTGGPPAPQGNVVFTLDGTTTISGAVNSSGVASALLGALIAGPHTVSAAYTSTNGFAPATAPTVILTVAKAATSASVTSNANPVFVQNSITLTADVTSTAGTPTGTVTFLDGTTPIGTGTLSGGTTTLITSNLTAGTHSITVAYGGDTNFAVTASSALTQVVEDFTLSFSTTSATVQPGGSAVFKFTVTPVNGTTFPASISLIASGLPSGVTYNFSPTSLAEGAGATPVTLTISIPQAQASTRPVTRQPGSQLASNGRSSSGGGSLASRLAGISLALLLLPFVGRLRRAGKRFSRMLPILLLLIAGLAAAVGLSGCIGRFGPPQIYTVTVTATSGTLSHTSNVTLTVE